MLDPKSSTFFISRLLVFVLLIWCILCVLINETFKMLWIILSKQIEYLFYWFELCIAHIYLPDICFTVKIHPNYSTSAPMGMRYLMVKFASLTHAGCDKYECKTFFKNVLHKLSIRHICVALLEKRLCLLFGNFIYPMLHIS